MVTTDKVEILPVTLLDQNRSLVGSIRKAAARLGIGLGWHYLLDISWILSHMEKIPGARVLDAGAGEGVLQWMLAERGAQVISVDRRSRSDLSLRFRARYRIVGLRSGDLSNGSAVLRRNIEESRGAARKLRALVRGMGGMAQASFRSKGDGKVFIYNADLKSLAEVGANTQDYVVAVSALEHNDPESLPLVVEELMRVLKPGGILLATLGAARDQDWFHEASSGWCYTDASLKRLFSLSPEAASNYSRYDEYFAGLVNCAELRDNLADFYFHSGDNGMPWGRWDPQYQPVGVLRVKV